MNFKKQNISKDIFVIKNMIMGNNSVVITNNDTVFIIDPSFNFEYLYSSYKDFKNKYVILTHSHYDHIGNIDELNNFADSIIVSTNLKKNLDKIDQQIFFNSKQIDQNKLKYMIDKSKFLDFTFFVTPGHSVDSMCIKYKNLLMSGDHVFANGIGRVDLPLSSKDDMIKSLSYFKDILENDDEIEIIIPGHDDIVSKQDLLSSNSFLQL